MLNQSKDQVCSVLLHYQSCPESAPLQIVSGEGESGTVDRYDGKRTWRGLALRLARERRGGDRWAVVQTADGYRG